MEERVFLGWDEPLLGRLIDWLWERRSELPGMTVVVPTAQSGRRLREGLAERGACLAPEVVTPGHFLRTDGLLSGEVRSASVSAETLAWLEVLEDIKDWQPYRTVFPVTPGEGEAAGWALPLARSLMKLERDLQESAVTLEGAARRLDSSIEAERWHELAMLWKLKEARLSDWKLVGRSRLLMSLMQEPVGGKVVLACVPDLPMAVARRLKEADGVVLIGAPEYQAEGFDELGGPIPEQWSERPLSWPSSGEVVLSADPRQQANDAVQRVAQAGTASTDLALGSADDETAEELVRAFGRHGWVLHNPAGSGVASAKAWFAAWRAWLSKPRMAEAMDLLGFPGTIGIAGGGRAQRAMAVSSARDRWLARDREDVERIARISERERSSLENAAEGLEKLEIARSIYLRRPFASAMSDLLERVDRQGEWQEVLDWVDEMEPIISRLKRDAVFWLDLMMADLSEPPTEPPEGRAGDVQGWLELLHEPGSHLVVCGMNEGRVPSAPAGDAWLSDGVRGLLGLSTDARRAARDAYVFEAITQARGAGRVDLLLSKASGDGDALLPSRLLLSASKDELPERVKQLFREVEPSDVGISWTADWKWDPPVAEPNLRLSVTAFSDYLACPFRFYLKYVVGMWVGEPERVEWNARDFGNVCHKVLENWANDDEAREFSKAEALEEWLVTELDRVVAERFGTEVPLAVRIQVEGLRQRLAWFALKQACERASGWRVVAAEEKFEREMDGVTLVGTVDRIDVHDDGRKRVLDYKTFNELKDVEKSHRVGVTAATRFPAHLEDVAAVLGENAKGKPTRWTNLQVPLYSWAIEDVTEAGYFVLGASEAQVGMSLWNGFDDADRESAVACACWVIGQVKAGVFEPPAEKVTYDDFELLGVGRPLENLIGKRA
ncbi:MAG: PD-(D/E)XK nuclease family protein [Verrucomicrobiota bacterium]